MAEEYKDDEVRCFFFGAGRRMAEEGRDLYLKDGEFSCCSGYFFFLSVSTNAIIAQNVLKVSI